MRLQLVRNATMRITYDSVSLVTDPLLAQKLTMPPYAGKSRNPLVDLPFPPEQVLRGAEMLLLSHLHSDHFDTTAQRMVDKELPVVCQPTDQDSLSGMGFRRVRPVDTQTSFAGITIIRTEARHGRGAVLEEMGSASGYVLKASGEPTFFWAGDSVLCDEILRSIHEYRPDVIVTHSSGAVWGNPRELIVMDDAQTVELCRYCPASVIVAVHMDSLDHGTVSRTDLVRARERARIRSTALQIPQDGETLMFQPVPGR